MYIDVNIWLLYNEIMEKYIKKVTFKFERMFLVAISDAQKKAVRKYKESNYDRIELSVPKGRKADLQEHAKVKGESLNGFVVRAIDETVKRDKGEE